MPDPLKQTVSASQAAALFNQHLYYTRWQLFHHFRNGIPLEPKPTERIDVGVRLQTPILLMTRDYYRLDAIDENIGNEYWRNGPIGATLDGRCTMPDIGDVIVEAKNVDVFQWREKWTDEAAPVAIEIQVQICMEAAKVERGIIAALVGGNSYKPYERERNKELVQQVREEAALFLESVQRNQEPDPLGDPRELPFMAKLYPTVDPAIVVHAEDDIQLGEDMRQYKWAANQRKFAENLEEQMKAKILARAGSAGVVIARGATAYVSKSARAAQMCQPHAVPKQLKKAGVNTTVKIIETELPLEEQTTGMAP